jgi:hypothetical protein
MDINRKTCDIRNWKKNLFLDIFSTNIDTLVPSLYQCVETRGIDVFGLLCQPLSHLVGHHLRLWSVLERMIRFRWQTLSTVNIKYFFMNILCIGSFRPQNTSNRALLFGSIQSTAAILTTETSLWTCASATYIFLLWKENNCLGNAHPA